VVAFLTDEGPDDRVVRWWLGQYSAGVAPILIKTGFAPGDGRSTDGSGHYASFRRIGLDPVVFDGTDPAAFVWAIFEIECRLSDAADNVRLGDQSIPLPLGVPVAYGGCIRDEGDEDIVRRLRVAPGELREAVSTFEKNETGGSGGEWDSDPDDPSAQRCPPNLFR
jgi:hypothetical protein